MAAMEEICTRWCKFHNDCMEATLDTIKECKDSCGRGLFDELLEFANDVDFVNRTATCQKNNYKESPVSPPVASAEDIISSMYGHSCGSWAK